MAEVYRWVPNGVARMAGNSAEMDATAELVMLHVKRRAQAHRLTGDYISKLSIKNVPGKKGVRDRMIFAGDKAAYSIEWGHWAPRKGAPGATWVPGQHILGGAVTQLPGPWSSHMRFG
jgi:hypothetical protein